MNHSNSVASAEKDEREVLVDNVDDDLSVERENKLHRSSCNGKANVSVDKFIENNNANIGSAIDSDA